VFLPPQNLEDPHVGNINIDIDIKKYERKVVPSGMVLVCKVS
jgi:hypothetical protein